MAIDWKKVPGEHGPDKYIGNKRFVIEVIRNTPSKRANGYFLHDPFSKCFGLNGHRWSNARHQTLAESMAECEAVLEDERKNGTPARVKLMTAISAVDDQQSREVYTKLVEFIEDMMGSLRSEVGELRTESEYAIDRLRNDLRNAV